LYVEFYCTLYKCDVNNLKKKVAIFFSVNGQKASFTTGMWVQGKLMYPFLKKW